ncbi:hypothetical protein [Microbacterium sp. NIBRBAC000506063]|uniref:hypothetical protein n=1 Tax=Microbacterium sp. NIBRBAC000506063 TaxID=2734618 RepID=UPI00397FE66B
MLDPLPSRTAGRRGRLAHGPAARRDRHLQRPDPRVDPRRVAFPNVDFSASLVRDAVPGWVGLDIRVSFGPDGTGLTETVLHDEQGPSARSRRP